MARVAKSMIFSQYIKLNYVVLYIIPKKKSKIILSEGVFHQWQYQIQM
jgi:hypothetical protein